MIYTLSYVFLGFCCSLTANQEPESITETNMYISSAFTIPHEFLLDDKRPIDASEDQLVFEKQIGNIYATEDEILFSKLPVEVQTVIRLTTGERYTTTPFNLSVILSHDPTAPKRSVKSYVYTPLIFDKNIAALTLAMDNWTFKKQDQLLKLEQAELDH